MRKRNLVLVSYLDDFLLISSSEGGCCKAQISLIELLGKLGFSVQWPKIVGPSQRIQFLGLIVDSVKERLELPSDKLVTFSNLTQSYSVRSNLTKKELETIVGHMSFAGRAIFGARTFTRILIDAMKNLKTSRQHICVTKLLWAELQWWANFSSVVNGLRLMGTIWPVTTIWTDASFSGFGAVSENIWLLGAWDTYLKEVPRAYNVNQVCTLAAHDSIKVNFNFLELIAACIAILLLAPTLSLRKVFVLCDNTQSVAFLNRGTTKNVEALMWLKLVFSSSLRYGLRVVAVHLPGVQNVSADALSCITESATWAHIYWKHGE